MRNSEKPPVLRSLSTLSMEVIDCTPSESNTIKRNSPSLAIIVILATVSAIHLLTFKAYGRHDLPSGLHEVSRIILPVVTNDGSMLSYFHLFNIFIDFFILVSCAHLTCKVYCSRRSRSSRAESEAVYVHSVCNAHQKVNSTRCLLMLFTFHLFSNALVSMNALSLLPSIKAYWRSTRLSVPLPLIECPGINSKNSTNSGGGGLYLAGITLDASKIQPRIFSQLIEYSCVHQAEIFILTREARGRKNALSLYKETQERCFGKDAICARFDITLDPFNIQTLYPNRVDRIAVLRDFQRERVRAVASSQNFFSNAAVIVADLDLWALPATPYVIEESKRIIHGIDHDIICSSGLMHHPFGYYDIFATVLKPSTFVYPLSGRLIKKPGPSEDLSLIRSQDVYGTFTQEGLLRYFHGEGRKSPSGTVEVQSCFGGLAIYRASLWMDKKCAYALDYGEDLMRYANEDDKRPCEHIVFHHCLHNLNSSSIITVQPAMRTIWERPFPPQSHIISGGEISNGLIHSDGMVKSSFSPNVHHKLINGNFTFFIERTGSMVIVEDTNDMTTKKWEKSIKSIGNVPWDYLFVTLSGHGEMIVTHQSRGESYIHTPKREIVWTSRKKGESFLYPGDFVLHLGCDGVLRVIDNDDARIIWHSASQKTYDVPSDVQLEIQLLSSKRTKQCLPSGTQDDINQALDGPHANAVLCQNATFNLTGPIIFTASHQRVFTQGKPTRGERATLRITDPSVSVAVNMLQRDFAQLTHTIVDGNLPSLGPILFNSPQYGEALVRAGGEAKGQVLRFVGVFGSRTWAALHIAEGDPSMRCSGAVIEDCALSGGNVSHRESLNGIAMACPNSLVRRNRIVDVSGSGIVIFGSPGTVVETNHIISATIPMNVGVSMVDYDPYDGSFNGTLVAKNVIEAQGAMMGIGIAMGSHLWRCDLAADEDVLWGATVSGNVLKGSHMQYNFVVAGVRDWTMIDNANQTSPTDAVHLSLPCGDGSFLNEMNYDRLSLGTLSFPITSVLPVNISLVSDGAVCVEQRPGKIILRAGMYICSPNKRFIFGITHDGHISLLDQMAWPTTKVWSISTKVSSTHAQTEFQKDGNLVVKTLDGSVLWSSKTPASSGESSLVLGDDGIVSIFDDLRRRVWSARGIHTSLYETAYNSTCNKRGPLNGNNKGKDWRDMLTLDNKVMAGYQGWFYTGHDGGVNRWTHWSSNGNEPGNSTFAIDIWPNMLEYDDDELAKTSLKYVDGSNVGLFSSYNAKTVQRHCRWLYDYGIDGVFVQRFIVDALAWPHIRDQVLHNVRIGSELHGRIFANMYDITGGNELTLVDDIKRDWMHLVDDELITNSSSYLHHRGKPVVAIWGWGFEDRVGTPDQALDLIRWFQHKSKPKYRATVIGGTPIGWRTLSTDSKTNTKWADVYRAFDVISPWTVGRFSDENGSDLYRTNYIEPDIKECKRLGIDYLPVVFPGFSFYNKGKMEEKQGAHEYTLNAIPRRGGNFFWRQFRNVINAGSAMIFVAMFDEVNEGTAIFKLAEKQNQVPANSSVIALDADEEYSNVPSDLYLQLTGKAGKILKGFIGNNILERNITYQLAFTTPKSMCAADLATDEIPRCTYEMLRSVYNSPLENTRNARDCWRFEDHVLKLPQQAIVNRNCMKFLGKGSKGIVHQAIISLNATNVTNVTGARGLCIAAVKTDQCEDLRNDRNPVSCLQTNSSLLKGTTSHMNSERMGALIFLASQRAHRDISGLLPTWGLVEANDVVIGAIMPVLSFEPLSTTWKRRVMRKEAIEVAEIMLPVVDGFAFVDHLGLSFQDVHEKNIGMVLTNNGEDYAFAYDNTYLSMLHQQDSSSGAGKSAANFCAEGNFIFRYRQPNYTVDMIRRKDCFRLLDIITETIALADPTRPAHGQYLFDVLDHKRFSGEKCRMEDVANILRQFVEKNKKQGQLGVDAYKQKNFPCVTSRVHPNKGFFFAKIPKTAGTTIAGVARRITRQQEAIQSSRCHLQAGHERPRLMFGSSREDHANSFLWTFLREPRERTMSSFFYHEVSRKLVEPTDENFYQWIKSLDKNYQTEFLFLDDSDNLHKKVNSILQSYDFIGITERLDESLVVLALLFGISIDDVLYMSSKRTGYAFTGDGHGNFECIRLAPKTASEFMVSYLNSSEWVTANQYDLLLYSIANKKLDATISSLGRQKVKHHLTEFRAKLRQIQHHCNNQTIFPCSNGGILDLQTSNCYTRDEGCGYECIDEVLYDMQTSRKSHCIPSGTQDDINQALDGPHANAVLCQNATFNLTGPIIFTASHQRVFTQGKPTRGERATLRITDPSVSVAVNMLQRDFAQLTHTIVDGNLPSLGPILFNSPQYGEALVRAGGVAKGQVLRFVGVFGSRTWAALHIAEGDPSMRCSGAVIEDCALSGGNVSHRESLNGIAMACPNSLVRRNRIVDVSGSGIVIFGSPGTVVETNHIISATIPMNVGVSMVDYDPYDGSFNGTLVAKNVIEAQGAMMGIGIAMGSHLWRCDLAADEDVLWGATVSGNVLKGSHMQYNFVVAGVRDWTMIDNANQTSPTDAVHLSLPCGDDKHRDGNDAVESLLNSGTTANRSVPGNVFFESDTGTLITNLPQTFCQHQPSYCSDIESVPLLSFPNSGTTYTLFTTQKVSSGGVATSYMKETEGNSIPVFKRWHHGPSWLPCQKTPPFWLPCPWRIYQEKGAVLTKTHCGGYSIDISPRHIFGSADKFYKDCSSVFDSGGSRLPLSTSLSLGPRAVHLIRDPFDNIVSRFHHEHTVRLSREERHLYPKTREGFRSFCNAFVDIYFEEDISHLLSEAESILNSKVPCLADFFRYIIWHNNAIVMEENEGLVPFYIHYERFGSHWNETVNELVSFLEHNVTDDSFHRSFHRGKRYHDYYSDDEIHSVKELFEMLASEKLRSLCSRYFLSVPVQSTENKVANGYRPKLPFILAPSEIEGMPLVTATRIRHLSPLTMSTMNDIFLDTWRALWGDRYGKTEHHLAVDIAIDSKGERKKFLRCDDDSTSLCVVFENAGGPNITSMERKIFLPSEIGSYESIGSYIEGNGTVTLVLDTQSSESSSVFTIIQARGGCTHRKCNSWRLVGISNFLELPKNCSFDKSDLKYACPCHAREPTIWYDKPMRKWRLLFHQFPSKQINGECNPGPHDSDHAGGYAETVGESPAGPWIYNYFRPAYGNSQRVITDHGERGIKMLNHSIVRRPTVILSADGGLDGGYLVNIIGDMSGDLSKTDSQFLLLRIAIRRVVMSAKDELKSLSGRIYVTYHAETFNKHQHFPLGIGPTGIRRANYMATLFSKYGEFDPPKTIIAAQTKEVNPPRGQRMEGTVTPLAKSLGLKVIKGPLLLDDPEWTYIPANKAARMALKALVNGTVLLSWWSYTEELCQQLGTSCKPFEEFGEMLVIEIEDSDVVSISRTTDGAVSEDNSWNSLSIPAKEAAEVLGYNQSIWDCNELSDHNLEPASHHFNWHELSSTQKNAARTLGYNEMRWKQHKGVFAISSAMLADADRDEKTSISENNWCQDCDYDDLITEFGCHHEERPLPTLSDYMALRRAQCAARLNWESR